MNEDPRRLAPVLWLLTALFALRVLGQALVVFVGVAWLPAPEAWMSGLLPYPGLLPSQLLILALYVRISLDFTRGDGPFVRPRPVFARGVWVFGLVYFGAMVLRLVLFGPGIPVVFHFVLSGFLILFAAWHRARLREMRNAG